MTVTTQMKNDDWIRMHITDATGRKGWNGSHSPCAAPGQERELRRHLANIKARSPAYPGWDADTAILIIDPPRFTAEDDTLLAELMA